MPLLPRRSLLAAGALAGALALSACSGDPAENAPDPVDALPSPVQSLVTTTDVGQYLVTPKEGVTKEEIEATLAKLRTMEGVQSAVQRKDGVVDLQFRGDPSAQAREAAVKQLATLGEVEEGV